jgi:hypothetical protein
VDRYDDADIHRQRVAEQRRQPHLVDVAALELLEVLAQVTADARSLGDRPQEGPLLLETVRQTSSSFIDHRFTSQYAQLGIGLTPLQAGLAGVPAIVALMTVSNVVPALTAHARQGYAFAGGLAVTATGFLVLTPVRAHAGVGLVVAATIVVHVGIAPPMVLGTQLIVGSATAERAGVASGMGETANALGAALGIALLGSLATAIDRHDVADQVPSHTAAAVRDTFAGAVDAAHSLPAGAVVKGLLAAVAVVTLRHVGRPDTGVSSPRRPSCPRRSRPRPPSPGAASAQSARA